MILDQLGIELRAIGAAGRLRPRPLSPRTRLASRAAVVGIAVATGVIGTTGVGYAYWRTTGTGTGTATTGTASITVPTAVTVSGLYPGASKPVTLTVKNTSASAPVTLQDALATKTELILAASASGSACDANSVTFTKTALPASAIPAAGTGDVLGNVTMDSPAGNQCQGATFTVSVSITGKVG